MRQDNIATMLVIQIMPLLMREFQIKLDPQLLFADQNYADSIIHLASSANNERLKNYAALLRDRLRVLLLENPAGEVPTLRGSSSSSGGVPSEDHPYRGEAPPPRSSSFGNSSHTQSRSPGDDEPEDPSPSKYIRSLR